MCIVGLSFPFLPRADAFLLSIIVIIIASTHLFPSIPIHNYNNNALNTSHQFHATPYNQFALDYDNAYCRDMPMPIFRYESIELFQYISGSGTEGTTDIMVSSIGGKARIVITSRQSGW